MYYEEDDEEKTYVGDFTRFENGRVAFIQSFDDIFDQRNFKRIVNHIRGERMEIYSHESDHLIYHGEFNEKREREGWGIEYDAKTGSMLLEGIWKENKLVEIIRKIEGSIMIEFKRNGDNTKVFNRIPVFVGEFVYDEEKESFIRNGGGYWIDEETRIATREVEWKNGVEVSGRDLVDGWYALPTKTKSKPIPLVAPIRINVSRYTNLSHITVNVSDLTISPNCGNDLVSLDLNQYRLLRSVEIGNDCFGQVKKFQIDGLYLLRTLKISKNSFTQKKNGYGNDKSKSFLILNCQSLESIRIGEYSFSDFAGGFELNSLTSLSGIHIGTHQSNSYNFYNCSFAITGYFHI